MGRWWQTWWRKHRHIPRVYRAAILDWGVQEQRVLKVMERAMQVSSESLLSRRKMKVKTEASTAG